MPTLQVKLANVGYEQWRNRPRVAAGPGLVGPQSQRRIELDVLRDAERIVNLDPEIANGGSSERCLLGTEATFPVRNPRYF